MKNYSIAIDGPAGAGKSTVAKEVAKELGFIYIDTGAMYRAMGLYFHRKGISMENEEQIATACKSVDVAIGFEQGEQIVYLNGENVNGLIRTPEAGVWASTCSVKSTVRKKLVELQQQLAQKTNVVMDGRDIGTQVLPEADLKIYLTASVKTRALRRYKELLQKNENCSLEQIEESIIQRDERDMNREISPLRQAEDALLIDSSDLLIEDVVRMIIERFQSKKGELSL